MQSWELKAKEALTQIEDRQYDAELKLEGYHLPLFCMELLSIKSFCRVAVKSDMSAKIQGIPHASAYAWRIPVHYFTVIAKNPS